MEIPVDQVQFEKFESVNSYASRGQCFRDEIAELRAKGKLWQPQTILRSEFNTMWPVDTAAVYAWRRDRLNLFEEKPYMIEQAKAYYKNHPIDFINQWCDTYDPRLVGKPGRSPFLPFVMFERQEQFVKFMLACYDADAPGLCEKSRDVGATWVAIAFSVWLYLFWPGVAIGWGSNKEEQVEVIGDPKSIFEKIRMLIKSLPRVFVPQSCLIHDNMKAYYCGNPSISATISGEIGPNIGRGGRTRIYMVDEAAHLEYPEKVEASLSATTRVRIDISSVSGLGTVFHRTRESGVEWEPGKKAVKGMHNIFVLDWSDHPDKSREWHDQEKTSYKRRGMVHVFAREIERDYAAAREGVIIPAEWAHAAEDAHVRLGFDDSGGWVAGLDIADQGLDVNALVMRQGSVVKNVDEWEERDVGVTARRAIAACSEVLPCDLMYDSIGLGSAVKAEVNRLMIDEKVLPKNLKVIGWGAGAAVLDPNGHVIKKDNGQPDKNSPINKNFFGNLKAQAWWQVARRFQNTYRAIRQLEGDKDEKDFTWKPEDLISLSKDDIAPLLLAKLKRELSQAVMVRDARSKMIIDKAPEGSKSPNIADALVMCVWPIPPPPRGQTALGGSKILNG